MLNFLMLIILMQYFRVKRHHIYSLLSNGSDKKFMYIERAFPFPSTPFLHVYAHVCMEREQENE